MAASTSKSMKEYLKRYECSSVEDEKKNKKRKKKRGGTGSTVPGAIVVVDEDPVWQNPVNLAEEENEDGSADEEKPQIDEDIEVKRIKRLEQLSSKRSYYDIADDGSGWVPLSTDHSERVDQDADLSPPRSRKRIRNDTPSPQPGDRSAQRRNDTPSPEARQSRELNSESRPDGDMSPPRRRRVRNDTASPEPGRNRDDDLSPARQKNKNHRLLSPDASPPRPSHLRQVADDKLQRLVSSDLSPPRRVRRSSDDIDLSPPRRGRRNHEANVPLASSASDLSPPRKKKDSDLTNSKDQRRGGLISAEDTSKHIAKLKAEEKRRFQDLDASVTGKGAEPVYRDKLTGKQISKEEILKSKEKEKPKEKKLEWGKGLAQKREAEERLREIELEKEKPFARTREDPDLDKMLKDRVRWGDPMAHLVMTKGWEPVLPDLGNDEKMKESGFIVPQEIPSHSWIKRGCPPASNRYGIRPGRHWDGVDRSNGFENGMFKRMNEKRATEREAYLWSVSDM